MYSDPSSIAHETDPTGDLYAIPEKILKQKKKGSTNRGRDSTNVLRS